MTPDELDAAVQLALAKREMLRAEDEANITARILAKEAKKEAWRVEHDLDLEISKEIKNREKEARRAENVARTQEPRYDSHVIEMAATFPGGPISPVDFIGWRRERQAEMAATPSLREQLADHKLDAGYQQYHAAHPDD